MLLIKQSSLLPKRQFFQKLLNYVQFNPKRLVTMKEKQTRNGLRLIITFENITTINKALQSLSPILV